MRKIYFASGIVCAALFSACSDFDFDEHRGVFKSEEYDANFEKMVGGEVHPAQDWGFGSTRTRAVDAHTWYKIQDYTGEFSDWDRENRSELVAAFPYAPKKTDRGEAVSTDEFNYVMKYLAEHPNEGGPTPKISTYFIQLVGKSHDNYNLDFIQDNGIVHHSTTIDGSSQMDYFELDGVHVNDYNAQEGPRELLVNWPLNNPTYHDSYSNITYNAYQFYYIEYNGVVNCYLCFDYCTKKYDNGQLDYKGDGVYNDWVIKIVPGDGTPFDKPGDGEPGGEEDYITGSWRIFGEDLGTTDDFDFNDVVFDVHIYNSGKAVIDLLAAGGTMPLYVGDRDHEVHEQFGVAVDCMVNTGASNGVKKPIVTYTLEGNYTRPSEISISVDHGNFTYVLEAEKGKAPQKIAVSHETDPDVKWPAERQHITDAYPGFSDYATKKASNWTANPNSTYLY